MTRRIRIATGSLIITLGAYAFGIVLLPLAFDAGGVNGAVGRFMASTWPVWAPALTALEPLESHLPVQLWPTDMLSQVRGARRAEAAFRTGERPLYRLGIRGTLLPGIDDDDLEQLGPRSIASCKITWDDRDIVYVQQVGEPAPRLRPARVPAGYDEIMCSLPGGQAEHFLVELGPPGCMGELAWKGHNQRMLSLLLTRRSERLAPN